MKTKEEIKAGNAAYYEEHKKEILTQKALFYQKHKEEKAVYNGIYREEHKEEIAVKAAVYYEEHKKGITEQYRTRKEEIAIRTAIYRKSHKKEIISFREAHKEEIAVKAAIFYQQHKEEIKVQQAIYHQTESYKPVRQRKTTKRNHKRRNLGFTPLNSPFKGAHGHHLNRELVVYIPKELHTDAPHNVWTGKGMFKINDLALTYFQPILTGVSLNEAENERT